MASALFFVVDPILHPLRAKPGQYVAWVPTQDVVVMERHADCWRVVRRLGFDNAGAIGSLHCDGALILVYHRGSIALPLRLRPLPDLTPIPSPSLALVR